jgi:hypothetical protein
MHNNPKNTELSTTLFISISNVKVVRSDGPLARYKARLNQGARL